jgi:HEAT repeat protein
VPLGTLLAMEERAAARGSLRTWLLAVGNSRAPAAEPVAQRLLGHADADVRAAACVALGRQPSAAALEALCTRGLGDASPAVRHEAVIALSHRSEPAARAALQQIADGDADASVRDRARRVLGGN